MTLAMTDTAASPRPAPAAGSWASYGELWRRVPGSAVYLLAIFVIASTAVGVLNSLFWTGVGLLILVIGLPIVVAALFVARGIGTADRFMLKLTGLPEILEPEWNRDAAEQAGFWATLTRPIRNPHYWIYLLHGAIVNPIISAISFALTVAWLSVGLGGLTYWFWGFFLPRDGGGDWGRYVSDAIPWLFGGWSSMTVQIVLYLLAGILFTFTMPWVIGGLARMHHAIARGMLGRWRSDGLAAEVRAEAAARGAAVQAEDAALRRLERDIHDGPQQRLVRLQLDLAALERRAEAGDADAAASLAREATVHAKAALDELRALSSGVAPPLLQDRGLVAALSALAANAGVHVETEFDPSVDDVPGEIARTVYFIVAELLTNVVKHAHATAATVKVGLRPTDAGAPRMLDAWVVDNGEGGAQIRPGHGLGGLDERVRGLRGTLTLASPQGGPTTVGAHIPVP